MSMEALQNAKHREVMSIRFYYDWNTYVAHAHHLSVPNIICLCYSDQLMEEAVKMMQTHLRAAPTMKKRAKTVLSQRCFRFLSSIPASTNLDPRSLGTIKDRKREKRTEKAGDNSADTILKILRMQCVVIRDSNSQLKLPLQVRTHPTSSPNRFKS